MAPTTQIFDPDGDLTFIIPIGKNAVDITPSSRHRPRKTPTREAHVHMKVSSKHMMLASPVFKAMLTGNLAEAVALRDNGTVEVPLPDDNAVVFAILMNSIHSRQRKVPRKVPLKLLGLLSVAVDKYQLHDAVATFSDGWLEGVKDTLASNCDTETLELWLSISWVFERAEEFSTVTGMLIRGSKDSDALRDMKIRGTEHDLPIPVKILGMIFWPSLPGSADTH